MCVSVLSACTRLGSPPLTRLHELVLLLLTQLSLHLLRRHPLYLPLTLSHLPIFLLLRLCFFFAPSVSIPVPVLVPVFGIALLAALILALSSGFTNLLFSFLKVFLNLCVWVNC